MLRPFSKERIQYSLVSMLKSTESLTAVVLSIYLSGLAFAEDSILAELFKDNPVIWNSIVSQDIWALLIVILVLLFLIKGIFRLITIPLYKYVIVAVSHKIAAAADGTRATVKRIMGGLWQLPKSIMLVLFVSLLLSLYSSFANNSALAEYINKSEAYQKVNKSIIAPMLKTDIAKQVPVFLTTSFEKAVLNLSQEGRKNLIYYNGMTLNNAVKSTKEIDGKARELAGTKTDEREKAYLIYVWVSESIEYDHQKAEIISYDPMSVSSGAIEAFTTGTGVCFDNSCLYIAMCRAVGLKVRFVTGQGYSGTQWGDHAWNQVYYPKEERWLNVDTTFGASGMSYFDSSEFMSDHKDTAVQAEW